MTTTGVVTAYTLLTVCCTALCLAQMLSSHHAVVAVLFESAGDDGDGGATDDIFERRALVATQPPRCSRAATASPHRSWAVGSGDPEVLPSGLHRCCASVDPGREYERG